MSFSQYLSNYCWACLNMMFSTTVIRVIIGKPLNNLTNSIMTWSKDTLEILTIPFHESIVAGKQGALNLYLLNWQYSLVKNFWISNLISILWPLDQIQLRRVVSCLQILFFDTFMKNVVGEREGITFSLWSWRSSSRKKFNIPNVILSLLPWK